MNTVEIIPAILPSDFNELVEKISRVKGLTKSVQVDICDGRFVPNMTWPYEHNDGIFAKIISQEEGLPAWENIDYEFDLMVDFKDPQDIEKWLLAGAARIILHAESEGDISKILENLNGRAEAGLALNLDTPISTIKSYEEAIRFVQLMGIERIGFQGQSFDLRVIEKIKEVKATYPQLPISIDGGVSLDNAEELIEAGASRLVVGSAIFGSENVVDTIREFQSL
jgi:ribulose-phosphate 3-epimerase